MGKYYDWFDERFGLEEVSGFLGKAFPAEDSFLLGEISLFCFGVLVLTGIFLGFFFEPSTTSVAYQGSVARYQGQDLPAAFVSVLNITYDVPYGMFLRRMHHWAAHLFVASIALHMLRVFFTGAYRNPREPNWIVGTFLAILGMGAAYTGYSLPFDEFASTATGIGYNLAKSIPFAGGVLSKIIFGGSYPSSATVPRFYFLHVFVIPVAIAALLAVHMAVLVRQKHTEAPRDGDVVGPDGERIDEEDDTWVVGLPMFPNQAAVSAVVFFFTLGVLSLLAGFLPVHNVALYGPNDPASTPALIMPDWFLMWVFGFLKLLPSWMSVHLLGQEWSTEFWGGIVLPTLVFVGIFAWPFVDRSEGPVHFTADPLARPWQTAVGVAAVVFIMVTSIAGMNNILARVAGVSTDVVNVVLQVATVLAPVGIGLATYVVLGGAVSDVTGSGGRDGGDEVGEGRDEVDEGRDEVGEGRDLDEPAGRDGGGDDDDSAGDGNVAGGDDSAGDGNVAGGDDDSAGDGNVAGDDDDDRSGPPTDDDQRGRGGGGDGA